MAKSKEQKETMLAQYVEWVSKSQAVVLVEYAGLKMSNLDAIRSKVREAGGEFHIVKNTLAKLALEKAGFKVPEDYSEKSTAIGFAFLRSRRVRQGADGSHQGHGSREDQRRFHGRTDAQARRGQGSSQLAAAAGQCVRSSWAFCKPRQANWSAPWPNLVARWLPCSRRFPKKPHRLRRKHMSRSMVIAIS